MQLYRKKKRKNNTTFVVSQLFWLIHMGEAEKSALGFVLILQMLL